MADSSKKFDGFPIGRLFRPLSEKSVRVIGKPKCSGVECTTPTRLAPMVLNLLSLLEEESWRIGEVNFSIELAKNTRVRVAVLSDTEEIRVVPDTLRADITLHWAMIMKKTLNFRHGLEIHWEDLGIYHVGLGSSAALSYATLRAINELCGNPISFDDLIRLQTQNYGEETDRRGILKPVPAVGGTAASGSYGGMTVLAGDSCMIARMEIPNDLRFVIAIPGDENRLGTHRDVPLYFMLKRLNREIGSKIHSSVINSLLPAMRVGNLREIGEVLRIFLKSEYMRLHFERMNPSKNMQAIMENLLSLEQRLNVYAPIAGISSTGPAAFVLTDKPETVSDYFKENLKINRIFYGIPNNNGATCRYF